MTTPTPETTPDSAIPPVLQDEKTMAVVIYGLYIAGWATGCVSSVIGLILAYVSREAAPEWLRTHYTFQIRTFWLSIAWFMIGCATLIFGVGIVILAAIGILVTVRAILGLYWLLKGRAYPTPYNWII